MRCRRRCPRVDGGSATSAMCADIPGSLTAWQSKRQWTVAHCLLLSVQVGRALLPRRSGCEFRGRGELQVSLECCKLLVIESFGLTDQGTEGEDTAFDFNEAHLGEDGISELGLLQLFLHYCHRMNGLGFHSEGNGDQGRTGDEHGQSQDELQGACGCNGVEEVVHVALFLSHRPFADVH